MMRRYEIVKFVEYNIVRVRFEIVPFSLIYGMDYRLFLDLFFHFLNLGSSIKELFPRSFYTYGAWVNIFYFILNSTSGGKYNSYINLFSFLFIIKFGLVCITYLFFYGLIKDDFELDFLIKSFLEFVFNKEFDFLLGLNYSLVDYVSFFYSRFFNLNDPVFSSICSIFLGLVYVRKSSGSSFNSISRVLYRNELQDLLLYSSYFNSFNFMVNSNSQVLSFFDLEDLDCSCLVLIDPSFTVYKTQIGHLKMGGLYLELSSLALLGVDVLFMLFSTIFKEIKYSSHSMHKLDGSFFFWDKDFCIIIKGITLTTPLQHRVVGGFFTSSSYVFSGGETGLKSEILSSPYFNKEELSSINLNFSKELDKTLRFFYFTPDMIPCRGGSQGKFYLKTFFNDSIFKSNSYFQIIFLSFRWYNFSSEVCCQFNLNDSSYKWSSGYYMVKNNCFCLKYGIPNTSCSSLVNKFIFISDSGDLFYIRNPYFYRMISGFSLNSSEFFNYFYIKGLKEIDRNSYLSHQKTLNFLMTYMDGEIPDIFDFKTRGYIFFKSHFKSLFNSPKEFYDFSILCCLKTYEELPLRTKDLLNLFIKNHLKGDLFFFFEFFGNNFRVIRFLGYICRAVDVFELYNQVISFFFKKFNNESCLNSKFFLELFSDYKDDPKIKRNLYSQKNLSSKVEEKCPVKAHKGVIIEPLTPSDLPELNPQPTTNNIMLDSVYDLSFSKSYLYLEKIVFLIVYFKFIKVPRSLVSIKKYNKKDLSVLKKQIIFFKSLGGWDLFSRRPIFTCFFSYFYCLLKVLYKPRVLKAFKTTIKTSIKKRSM